MELQQDLQQIHIGFDNHTLGRAELMPGKKSFPNEFVTQCS